MNVKTVGFLTVIKAELDALVEVLKAAGAPPTRLPRETETVYLEAHLPNVQHDSVRLVLACIGSAGNSDSSAAAMELISSHQPDLVVLSGIAAGLVGKTRIGEVIVSERVVGYEGAALIAQEDGTQRCEGRPEMSALGTAEVQDLVHYDLDPSRARDLFLSSGGRIPSPDDLQDTDVDQLCLDPSIRLQTVASGEKLLRDPRFLIQVKETLHGRIEVGEMEAAGIVAACKRTATPWLIFRGVSDFGDPKKSDTFHDYAARMAATVAIDFLRYGYEGSSTTPGVSRSSVPNEASPTAHARLVDRMFEAESHDDALGMLRTRMPIVAFLSVSPSDAASAASHTRYHLGHACFAQLFSEIVDIHPMPGMLISPSIVYAEWRTPQFNRSVHDICGRWLYALDDRVLPQLVTEAIYSQPISDEPFSAALAWLSESAPRQRVAAASTLRVLEGWRAGLTPPAAEIDMVLEGLELTGSVELSTAEILSLGYVLTKAPAWYSAEWMVRSLRSLCRVDDASIAQRFFNTQGLAILESSKNRVVWESLRALARIFDIEGFPPVLLSKTLPNLRLDGPMRSRDPSGCVALHSDLEATLSTVSVPFLREVGTFAPDVDPSGAPVELRAGILEFARRWQERLGQQPRG